MKSYHDSNGNYYDGKVEAQLTGRKVTLQESRQTLATTVAAGNTSQVTITPTAGTIAKVKHIGVFVPAIAGSTGSHLVDVTIGTSRAYTNEKVNEFTVAGTSAINHAPANNPVSTVGLTFTAAKPLVFTYSNGTNMEQTGVRMIKVLYEEEPIAL